MYRLIIFSKAIVIFLTFINTFVLYGKEGMDVISSNQSEIKINFSPVFEGFDTLNTDNGSTVLKPVFRSSYTLSDDAGAPAQPVFSALIEVPSKDGYELKSYKKSRIHSYKGVLNPVPEVHRSGAMSYKIDEEKYQNKNEKWISLEYLGISAGRHLAKLKMFSAKQNGNEILIPDKFSVSIAFKGENLNDYSSEQYSGAVNAGVFRQDNSLKKKSKFQNDDPAELSSGDWFKIRVSETGVYKLSASDLENAGMDISGDLAETVKIFGNGGTALSENVTDGINNKLNEQEIIVNKSSSGKFENLIFFGSGAKGFQSTKRGIKHFLNPYSKDNYYLITYGGTKGKRAEPLHQPEGEVVNKPSTYYERLHKEEENINPYALGGGKQWFWKSFFETPFVNKLKNLDRSQSILYHVALAHNCDSNAFFDIYENGIELGDIFLNSSADEYTYASRNFFTGELPASEIASDGRSILEFEYSRKSSCTYYLDYYEIHYPRSFYAVDNELSFIADSTLSGVTEFSVNGFSGSDVYGFEISDRKDPKLIRNNASTGGMFIFRTELDPEEPAQYYISSKLKSADIESIEFAGYRGKDASKDVIVITDDRLMESAKAFKEYRESHSNLSVGLFNTRLIYNEFGSGVKDLTAIRDFIAHAYHNWSNKPEFVLLWGDGHYDYKGLETKEVNHVPAYQANTAVKSFDEVSYDWATEDYYVYVDGDDLVVDLSLGRITINDNEMGYDFVKKLDHYENNSSNDNWRTRAILVADDAIADNSEFPEGDLHVTQSEKLSHKYIPDNFEKEKIYMAEYPVLNQPGGRRKPEVKTDLLASVNTYGGLLLNWIGHGNPRVWAHEEILNRDEDIKKMNNWDKLVFLTAATCDYGRFDVPSIKSGAEVFLESNNGGAIGVFSATRVVFSSSNSFLNNALYDAIFERSSNKYPTIGQIIKNVKTERTSTNDRKFFLLGDPTMRLLLPYNEIRIDSVNGIDVTQNDTIVNLKALSSVKIKGTVIDSQTGSKINGFNGNAILTMRESDNYYETYDKGAPNDLFKYTKHGAALNKSSYKVDNGEFTAEFVIPKDISFNEQSGRLFAYAYSENNNYARGNYNGFVVNGISDNPAEDNEGPEIDIYLDDRSFEEGDYVREQPLAIIDLFDDSGVNTTGLGIGHRIEVWIDDDPSSVDLTSKFSTSPDDSRFGTVEDYLPGLEPGYHRLKIRAWDVYNNFTVEETFFNIRDEYSGLTITDLKNYPNPFNEETEIRFKHDAAPPVAMQLSIYTVSGKKIYSTEETVTNALQAGYSWKALDNENNELNSGVYVYKIHLTDSEGNSASKSGLMSLIKK